MATLLLSSVPPASVFILLLFFADDLLIDTEDPAAFSHGVPSSEIKRKSSSVSDETF